METLNIKENIAEIDWFEKTKEKAESLINDIDPDLEVYVKESKMTFDKDSKPIKKEDQKMSKAVFFKNEKLGIEWALAISADGIDDDFLNNRLEKWIFKTYIKELKSKVS